MIAITDFERALDQSWSGKRLEREGALELIKARGHQEAQLFDLASSVRDRGKGHIISYSKKVFIPLTNLCRDYCGYCVFRRDPNDPGAKTLLPAEVLEIVHGGETLGCKEALFSLGDKPENIFPGMRSLLAGLGFTTTIEYLRHLCEKVLEESSLLPHLNPGLMTERDLSALKEVSISMGIMLENVSPRLMIQGGPHFGAPDKSPMRRLRTIDEAGKQKIPFTTGILIGIGETLEERVDSLLAIRELNDRHGHIQEIIVQNFRAKPGTRMYDCSEPTVEDHARTIAVTRLLFGEEMNIQAPPNLAPEQRINGSPANNSSSFKTLQTLIRAGVNDWGGISPLTPDHISPERPWPEIELLGQHLNETGFELRERLAIYPEFIHKPGFLVPALGSRVMARVDADGYPN
jgi:FO synthase